MKLLRLVFFLILMAAVFVAGYGYRRWYAKPAEKATAEPRRILYYFDPMHPAYTSDKPGIAPDCGMKLEPRYADEQTQANPATAAEAPAGSIQISSEKQQLIGVRYGMPEVGSATKSIRAVGKVTPDERRIVHVHTRVDAWVEKVFVDFTGKEVTEGQPLLTLYSPELVASEEELLLALKARDTMKASSLAGTREQSESMLAAARRRLQLWDLSGEQIEEVERTRRPINNTTLYAPASGYVTARNAFPKLRITPETELYTLVDLRSVWVMADFFEADLSSVHPGQSVTLHPSYAPQRTIRGRIDYVQPQIDPVTRTLKVRIDVDNPDVLLKPEMFVEVQLAVGLPTHLMVPTEAVLDSGLKKTVFVDRGNGYIEPRSVETGERVGDRVEILRGLRADERIVVSGTFLIDSESQLRSATSSMGSGKEPQEHRHD